MKTYLKLIDEIQNIGQKHNQTDLTHVCQQLIELLQQEKPKSDEERQAIGFAIQQLEASDLDGAYRTLEPFAHDSSWSRLTVAIIMLAFFGVLFLILRLIFPFQVVAQLSVFATWLFGAIASSVRLYEKSPRTPDDYVDVFVLWFLAFATLFLAVLYHYVPLNR